jgi:hypothetical protein
VPIFGAKVHHAMQKILPKEVLATKWILCEARTKKYGDK